MTTKMKILVYGLNYAPELIGIGKYTKEMCEWLAARGHDVKVISSYPYYPEWKVIKPYQSSRYSRELIAGVEVIRCPLYVPSEPTGMRRVLHHLSFAGSTAPAVMWLALKFRPDVLFTVAPSQFIIPAALMAARISGARSWLHLQDFEVDSAFELGILSGQGLRRCAERVERATLTRFDRVSTISPKMMERLADKRVAPSRIVEFRNWVDTTVIRPQDRAATLRVELAISPQSIVALYSGSLAMKQGLENVIEAARRLNHSTPEIVFVICGTGAMRERLIEQAKDLDNVRFLDLRPQAGLSELLSMADIHLLPQRAEVEDLVLPSKLAGMLASGRPLIAMAKPRTQLALDVEGAGLVIPAGDPASLVSAVVRLADDAPLRAQLGQVGRGMALSRWDTQAILSRLEQHLIALVDNPEAASLLDWRGSNIL
jgi:colanic acid biosynthesis glycosyl transferase WcaI